MSEILFKDLVVAHIVKPRLKNSYISVDRESNVIVKTPKVSKVFVLRLLEQKESWIRKQLLKTKARPLLKASLEDEVTLFGEIYSIDSDEATHLRELLSRVKTANEDKILKCYDKFYLNAAKKHLSARVEHYSKLMGLEFSQLKFRKMKSRWGSCDSNGVITLNTKLMKVKREYIDYVVAHELAHLTHMNHSKKFHDLVDVYINDSKALRKEFRETIYL